MTLRTFLVVALMVAGARVAAGEGRPAARASGPQGVGAPAGGAPARAKPQVIDPPAGRPAEGVTPPAPVPRAPQGQSAGSGAGATVAPANGAPSLTDVVTRIDRILREADTSGAGARRAPPRAAPRRQSPKAATRVASASPVRLSWPAAAASSAPGRVLLWPPDIDPRRAPARPLGVRLSWPAEHPDR